MRHLPSVYGLQENYSYYPDEKRLKMIKDLAYVSHPKLEWVSDKIVQITLNSGVCSGLCAHSLLKFSGDLADQSRDEELAIAVFQARTWGLPFIRQGLRSYLFQRERVFNELKKGFVSGCSNSWPLLVFFPRITKIGQMRYAHTLLPYSIKEGLSRILIKVYDSNYPGDDEVILNIDKLTGCWNYKDKNSKDWILTINYLGNLRQKVPFMF